VREIERPNGREPGPRVHLAAVLAVLVAPALAPAATYGDIEVTIKNEPRGAAVHGYAEIEFLVVNRSAQAAHEVRLTHPKSSYSYGSDHIRAVTRTVTVEPGARVRVVIAYPEQLELSGSGTGVTVDGREQDGVVPSGGSSGSRGRSYGGVSSYGGPSYGSTETHLVILYSKSIDTRFPDWIGTTQMQLRSEGRLAVTSEAVRAGEAADQWSPNWLGYTRYDGIAVTADDLRVMPPEVRSALGQYAECGGCLLVLGRDPQLPGPWRLAADREGLLSAARPGFGRCFVTEQVDLSDAPDDLLAPVLAACNETATPWRRTRTPGDANRVFPVVEDVGVPVKGLLILMVVFAVVIGPLNLVALARKKRKLWLFWTVPLISFATCLAVVGFMALSEGWQGRTRIEGVTLLDENSRRASSLGWTGFYTPLLPSGGLHFSPETELGYQNGADAAPYSYRRRRSSGSALTIDWTREQHLASGWLTPRVPAHFALRRSELRRERVAISKGAGGAPEAVNGLGADLSEFWYLDERDTLFHADAIPAGARAALTPVPGVRRAAGAMTLRGVYTGDWSVLAGKMKADGPALLAPRTYLAVMEAAPFLDDALPGASVRKARSVVYGILKEGGGGD